MKKELGKWLMDVAKYSVTAGLLSYWFKGMEGWNSPSYFIAIGFIMIVLTIGLILVRDDKMAKRQIEVSRVITQKRNGGNDAIRLW